MPRQSVVLKVFVSSPGDVGEERLVASRVIERLRAEWAGRAELEPLFWEHEPLAATASFQTQIPRPSECDVVVAILWSRLGTRLPPEVRRADGSRWDSGTEYELEDAAVAHRERGRPHLLVYRKDRPFEIGRDRRGDEERWRQKQALDGFLDRWLQHDDGSLRRAFHSFSGPAVFEERLETHLRALIEREWESRGGGEGAARRPLWAGGSPYRGLQPFAAEHAAVFCGRTSQVAAVLERLRAQVLAGRPCVVVAGGSGSGKTSLLAAGVVPTLTAPGVIEGVGGWRQARLEPGKAGGDLIGALSLALLAPGALEELCDETGEDELSRLLRDTAATALPLLRSGLSSAGETIARARGLDLPPRMRLVLVVDPLDELFSEERVLEGERTAFAVALATLVRSGMVWTLAAVRKDFQPRLATVPALAELTAGGVWELPPPTASELGHMVRQPARLAGLTFELDPLTRRPLDEVLCDDAGSGAAALPLLEFTLDQLYERRDAEARLTFDAYRELGGVDGALARRAEEVFASLGPAAREALPGVLGALVGLDETSGGPRYVRRRPPRGEVLAAGLGAAELVEALVAERLLVADSAADGTAVLSLADEALLTHWPRAQGLVGDLLDALRVRTQLQTAAALWRQNGYLVPAGSLLENGEALAAAGPLPLGDEERALLAASRAAVDAEERRRRRRRQLVAAAAGVAVALAGIGAWLWAIPQRDCYTNFTKRWGVPEGIGPLDDDQVRRREWSLCFEREGRLGRVERIVAVDSDDRPTPNHWVGRYIGEWEPHLGETELADRPCSWIFEYDGDGRIRIERELNCSGAAVLELLYKAASDAPETTAEYAKNGIASAQGWSGASVVRLVRDEQGFDREIRYLDARGAPRASEGIFGLRFEGTGALGGGASDGAAPAKPAGVPRRLVFLDREGNPAPSAHWFCVQLEFVWSERGLPISIGCLDREGLPRPTRYGYTRLVSDYDEEGNQVGLAFLDRAGDPLPGLPRVRRRFDWPARTVVTELRDVDGRPYGGLGYSDVRLTSTRVDDEVVIEERYYLGEQPIHDSEGVAMRRRRYSRQGSLLGVAHYDERGEPIGDRRGVHRIEHRYEGDRSFQQELLDEHGEGVATGPAVAVASDAALDPERNAPDQESRIDGGYAVFERTLYDDGRLRGEAYRDAAGRLTCNSRSFARREILYDDSKRPIGEMYYDDRDAPAESIEGYASLRRSHGANGLTEGESFHDRTGALTAGSQGYATVRYQYDHADRVAQLWFYDALGRLRGDGAAQARFTWDEMGRITEKRYLGSAGEPAVADGFAIERTRYGPGHSVEISWLGSEGRPLDEGRPTAVRFEADAGGNVIAQVYLDGDENPTTVDGVARRELRYDRWNRVDRESLRDLAGNLVDGPLGYAELAIDYDRWGRPVRQRLLTASGEPPITGTAEIVQEFDRRGLPDRVIFLERDGRPTPDFAGCPEAVMSYDDRGFPVEISCRNGAGLPQADLAGRGTVRILRNTCGRPFGISVLDDAGREIAVRRDLPPQTVADLWGGWMAQIASPPMWPLPPDAFAVRFAHVLAAVGEAEPAGGTDLGRGGGGRVAPAAAQPLDTMTIAAPSQPQRSIQPEGSPVASSATPDASVSAGPGGGPEPSGVGDVDLLVSSLPAASERALKAYESHLDADGAETAAEQRLYGLLERFYEGADELTAEHRRASGRGFLRRVGLRRGEVAPEQHAAVDARLRSLASLAAEIDRERAAGAFDDATGRAWAEARETLRRLTAALR